MKIESVEKVLAFIAEHPNCDHVVFSQYGNTREHLRQVLSETGADVRDMQDSPREAVFEGHVARTLQWFNREWDVPTAQRILLPSRFLSLSEWSITRKVCVSATYAARPTQEYPLLVKHFEVGTIAEHVKLRLPISEQSRAELDKDVTQDA